MFVYINNSTEARRIPWETYYEMNGGLGTGTDVLTGESVTVDEKTVAAPKTALVVEYKLK